MHNLKAINNLGKLYRKITNRLNHLLKKGNHNISSDELLFLFEIFNQAQVCREALSEELCVKELGKNGNYVNSYLFFNLNLLQKKSLIKINSNLNSSLTGITQFGFSTIDKAQNKLNNEIIFPQELNDFLLNDEKINSIL